MKHLTTHIFTHPDTGKEVICKLEISIKHDYGNLECPPSTDYEIINHDCPAWVTDDMLDNFLDSWIYE